MSPTPPPTAFDSYAGGYDAALEQGIAVSGQNAAWFAEQRVAWLAGSLRKLGLAPRSVLDFGCGTGTGVPFLREAFAPQSLVGIDVSAGSLQIARKLHGADGVRFETVAEYRPAGEIDLAYCNGVFHHIPLDQRAGAMKTVFDALAPGGVFSFWENNPWNPGARYVMSRIPFDRDAVMVWPAGARRLAREAGFTILSTRFLFVFPRKLRFLRFVERPLSPLFFGAQYQVLCRKPQSK